MVDPSGEIPPWLAAVLLVGETIDPLPLDPLVWALIGWSAIETAKHAPDAVRAIGRLIDPPVRERNKTRPWRWWEGAPLARENLPQIPTPPPIQTFDPWVPLSRSTPQPRTDPRQDPRLTPCPPRVTTTPTPSAVVRVRHYSWAIDAIRSSMIIRSGDGLAIWVEYPITTSYDESAIQRTSESFMRPLNGKGGFVEFNVDLNKWTMEPDPNLIWVDNAKMIRLWNESDISHVGVGFPLDDPSVDPRFFDWQGNHIR
jgi:hypothetical protein